MPSERMRRQRRTLVRYGLYAFGVPACIVAMACVEKFARGGVGAGSGTDRRCGPDDHRIILFFYGPIALFLAANVVFFALTSRHLFQHVRDRAQLAHCRQPEFCSRNRKKYVPEIV
ncbi:unnamed protein product, partial [Darwinula stevensoni]